MLILLYADDTKFCRKIKSPDDVTLLQEDLNHISDWSLHSGLSFKSSKSHSSIPRSHILI